MPALTKVDISFSLAVPTPLFRVALWIVLLYRRVRYGYPFRRIKLTRGKYAIVDPEDFERLNQYKWTCSVRGYATRGVTIKTAKGVKKTTMSMQSLLCHVPDGMVVDHINRNPGDNRKANLRPATRQQNVWNRKLLRRKGKTRYIGIHWDKRRQKWHVDVRIDGRLRGFGSYSDEIEAARVYDKVAKKYRGEFAVLNFPEK